MSDFNRNELINKTLAEFRQEHSATIPKPSNLNKPKFHRPQPLEDFNYDAEEEVTGFLEKFKLIFPIIIVAIICFLGYAWYTDKFAISKDNVGQLPVVKASTTPLREKPEDPGGMKIVNRDKKVYDAISGKDNDKETKAESILPAPEEPLSHEEIVKLSPSPSEILNKLPEQEKPVGNETSGMALKTASVKDIKNNEETGSTQPNTLAKNTTTDSQIPKQAIDGKQDIPVQALAPEKNNKAESAKATVPATQEKPETTLAPRPEDKNKPVKSEKPKETIKAVTASDVRDVTPKNKPAQIKKANIVPKGYKVQIGSYRVAGDADASWKAVKSKFPDILSDLNDYIEKADLGDKGVYYRLQLTGFKSEADARKICQKLNSQKQGCFFVGK